MVTRPVCATFLRILNMVSAVRPGIREVEALIDHGKIRHDVSLYGLDQRRPVVQGWVLDLAAFEAAVPARPDPMKNLPTPALHGAQRAAVPWKSGYGNTMRACIQAGYGLPNQRQRLPDLVHSNLYPPQHIAFLIDGHLERNGVIRRIWMVAPDVPVYTRCAAGHTHDSQIPGFVGTQNA